MTNEIRQKFYSIRGILLRTVLPALLLINCLPADAQDSFISNPNLQITYLGRTEDKLLFDVSLDNSAGENFKLFIKDEGSNVLFVKKFSGKKFSQRFEISKEELVNGKLTFVLVSKNSQPQVFELATNTRIVEDVVVVKL